MIDEFVSKMLTIGKLVKRVYVSFLNYFYSQTFLEIKLFPNKNYKNVWDVTKVGLRGNFIALKTFIIK